MTLINAIGLIGLIGVVALIIIYVIRPNYQQKTVSSTYVWKLSLKKKKKRVPVSKIRNLLLFVSQMLALVCLAMILTKPSIVLKKPADEAEAVLILDTSASMRAESDEEDARFDRAVTALYRKYTETLAGGGTVSVILAGAEPEYLCKRLSGSSATTAERIESLTVEDCGYAGADLDAALKASEDVLLENPDAAVYVYTDADYYSVPDGVNVVNVAKEEEWNAGILDASAALSDGYYAFTVKIACYGKDDRISLTMEAYNVNASEKASSETQTFTVSADCPDGVPQTLIFKYKSDDSAEEESAENQKVFDLGNLGNYNAKISSFSSVHLSLDVQDNYSADDDFDIYGGRKQTLKIQYSSSDPNPFVNGILSKITAECADLWDIKVTEVKKGATGATEGFDLYIFEHTMPEKLPSDGVSFLFDPDSAPSGCGFMVGTEQSISTTGGDALYKEPIEHPVLTNIDANYIKITRYREVLSWDADYRTLLSWNGKPMLMVKNSIADGGSQVLAMNFSVAYSTIAIQPEFYVLFKNAFNYFFPATVDKYVYEVGEKATLNARGSSVSVTPPLAKEPEIKDALPANYTLSVPGTYELKQTTYYNVSITEYIYVKMPAAESDITGKKDNLYKPERIKNEEDYFKDLITYVAAALVAFLFIEWCLHLKDGV